MSPLTDDNRGMIEMLEHKRKRALANARRQKNKEELARHTKHVVRVSSKFWEQVAADYQREINSLLKY